MKNKSFHTNSIDILCDTIWIYYWDVNRVYMNYSLLIIISKPYSFSFYLIRKFNLAKTIQISNRKNIF